MVHLKDWVRVIQDYEEPKEKLIELVLLRNKGAFDLDLYRVYEQSGIIYNDGLGMFGGILQEIDEGQGHLREGDFPKLSKGPGYLIPICDHLGNVLYFINYSNERDKTQKYIIGYPKPLKESLAQIKTYGLEDTLMALEQDTLYVTEGVFDRLRLKYYGLPSLALLGTQATDYFKTHAGRFQKVVYIGDKDRSGQRAFDKMRRMGIRMLKIDIPRFKDIDEYAANDPEGCQQWIQKVVES